MNFEINDRIKQFIKISDITGKEFADILGVSPARISNIMNYRNRPDSDLLIFMADKYRNINLKWLLLGEGDMFSDQTEIILPVNPGESILLKKIIELASENGVLKEKVKTLQKQLGYSTHNLAAEP